MVSGNPLDKISEKKAKTAKNEPKKECRQFYKLRFNQIAIPGGQLAHTKKTDPSDLVTFSRLLSHCLDQDLLGAPNDNTTSKLDFGIKLERFQQVSGLG
jgi:hypothetical protein